MKIQKIPYENNEGHTDLFIEECECGMIVKSLNKKQCAYNFKNHKDKCDGEKDE